MRAAVTAGPGGPIEVTEVDEPGGRSGEVLVRVKAASVNRLDRMVFDRGVGPGQSPGVPGPWWPTMKTGATWPLKAMA